MPTIGAAMATFASEILVVRPLVLVVRPLVLVVRPLVTMKRLTQSVSDGDQEDKGVMTLDVSAVTTKRQTRPILAFAQANKRVVETQFQIK